MKNLIKIYSKINIKNKFFSIVLTLMIITNIVSFSLLIFIGKDEEYEQKIVNLQITFYFILINIVYLTVMTIILNNKNFYDSLKNGKVSMEIINGYNKKIIWFSKLLSQKIFITLTIIIQMIIVNILLIFYNKDYQPLLISQRLFFWIFLFFVSFILDLIYHMLVLFIKQETFITLLVFLTSIIMASLLLLNSLTKKNDTNGYGEVKINTSYRMINNVLNNYNNFRENNNLDTTTLIKSLIDLKLDYYIEYNFNNNFNYNSYIFNDEYINKNKDNIFIKFILNELNSIKNNKSIFNLKLNEIKYLSDNELDNLILSIWNNFYKVTDNIFYKKLYDNYINRINDNNINRNNKTFKYLIPNEYNFDDEKNNSEVADVKDNGYTTIKNNPEIAILINLYISILDEFYNINEENNYNTDIFKIYIEQTDLNDAYFNAIRFNLLNHLSNMLYGFNDERYDYFIANQIFGPISNLKYTRLVNDVNNLNKYRYFSYNFTYDYNKFSSLNNKFKYRSTIFQEKYWASNSNLKELIKVTNKMIMSEYPLSSLDKKYWTVLFNIEPPKGVEKPPTICKAESVKSISEIYSNQNYSICNLKNVYVSQYRDAQDSYNKPTKDDLLIYSNDKDTNFLGDSSIIDDNYKIDIYSENYFSTNKKGQILNYFALILPWFIILSTLDICTYFLFIRRFENNI
ncbi:hypothetical protein SCORR_v1c05810 [Spiroplasma corruscae]|uniref:Uncharacterized protein n=1 Tax=Spiroplasma corruscae TaxID=216934 RepID=A0A222EQ30_9MOLU|nr:hypothetical protein [Spiroplasma corruscae]ASP28353.1 hypothetical protein SCORR_v1c05810 [Spiroplasma corruscae]